MVFNLNPVDQHTKIFKVSTSEVSTFLTCKQRWMYAHHPSYNLEPRTLGIALSRGLVGHKALEIYYSGIHEGKLESESRQAALDYLMKEALKAMAIGDSTKSLMIGSLGIVIQKYFDDAMYIFDEYNILGVEQLMVAELTPEIYFAGRVDLALEEKKGPYRGYVVPFDHKFSYNFWPDMPIKMNAQISNYIWSYLVNGHRSRQGIINQLRYRENAVENFKQSVVPTNTAMRDTLIKNHTIAAEEIVDLKKKPTVDVDNGITRSVSKFNCEYCPFAELCHTELTGKDSSTMIKASYRPNSYGYDSVLDIE